MIETTDLSVGYRRRRRKHPILSDLNLSVAAGEMICVLGPNGIGKTTLLRTLAGLQRPIAGRISIGGRDATVIQRAERARLLGVVLSERIAVGALTARQMVALGRYAHINWAGRLTARDWLVVDNAIAAVGAEHLVERDCRELSDGETQRLSIARVLAQEPAVVILDEPSAFLDLSARVELMALLRHLARRQGLAVVASSHDLELALRGADRIWLLSPGGEIAVGAPEDLISAGTIANAFSTANVRFAPETLALRIPTSDGQLVSVNGPANARSLATTALEREGYRLAEADETATLAITLDGNGGGWRASSEDFNGTGSGFAGLADFARQAAMRLPQTDKSQGTTQQGEGA